MAKKSQPRDHDGWFGVLESCRALGEGGVPFTASQLSETAAIGPGPRSAAMQVASAWCGKFARWGYLERGEPVKSGGRGRPTMTYRVTKLGATCVERPGRLTRLLDHIDLLAHAHNAKNHNEGALYTKLFELAREIRENKAGER